MEEYKTEQPTKQEDVVNGHTNGEMASPRKGGVLNTLYPPGPKGGAGPRMKNHCRKFWWCDLLVVALIILIIVLPIVYVAIPKKAQHDINASTLDVMEQDVTSPSPDGVHLKIAALAKSGSSFHPIIEGFRAGLHLEGQDPFIYINVPQTKAEAETNITVEQNVNFASLDAFKEYNKVVMNNESFNVYMTGKTKVHQSGLRAISVDYNKKVTMKGLNKLQGLNITNIKILFGSNETLPDGSNMIGNVIIPNPSVMTIDLGNVTMNLAIDGQAIGTSLMPNLVLKPGTNNVSMQSTVSQLDVISLVNTKYKDAVIPLQITGNSSMVGDRHLEYYEAAIQSNTINLNLNIAPALAEIGINVTSLA